MKQNLNELKGHVNKNLKNDLEYQNDRAWKNLNNKSAQYLSIYKTGQILAENV